MRRVAEATTLVQLVQLASLPTKAATQVLLVHPTEHKGQTVQQEEPADD